MNPYYDASGATILGALLVCHFPHTIQAFSPIIGIEKETVYTKMRTDEYTGDSGWPSHIEVKGEFFSQFIANSSQSRGAWRTAKFSDVVEEYVARPIEVLY